MRMSKAAFIPVAAACALAAALHACGGSSPSGGTPPTTTLPPVTTPTPTPTPDWRSQCGQPSPPPLYGVKVSVQEDSVSRKLLDSKPIVENVGRGNPTDSYCGKVGFDWRAAFCETRLEGHPQRVACDALVVGRASDTGRYGPTWEQDDRPCVAPGTDAAGGCTNHADNQFLVIARGNGSVLACASEEWPATGEGSRCGGCEIRTNVSTCLH
jgi:hypothetical protein